MLEEVYSRKQYIGEEGRLRICKGIGGRVQRKAEYRSKEIERRKLKAKRIKSKSRRVQEDGATREVYDEVAI